MKKPLMLLLIIACAVFAEENTQNKNRIGLGISFMKENAETHYSGPSFYMNPLSSYAFPYEYFPEPIQNLSVPSVFIPILINKNFRLEPEFGFSYVDKATKYANNTVSVLQWGLNIIAAFPIEKICILVGGRVRTQYIRNKINITEYNPSASSYMPPYWPKIKRNQTNVQFGPFVGCEIELYKHLVIAGHVRFNYNKIGEWSNDDLDRADKLFQIQPLIILYWMI